MAILFFGLAVNLNQVAFLSIIISSIYINWWLLREHNMMLFKPVPFLVAYTICIVYNAIWLQIEGGLYWHKDVELNDYSLKFFEKIMSKF